MWSHLGTAWTGDNQLWQCPNWVGRGAGFSVLSTQKKTRCKGDREMNLIYLVMSKGRAGGRHALPGPSYSWRATIEIHFRQRKKNLLWEKTVVPPPPIFFQLFEGKILRDEKGLTQCIFLHLLKMWARFGIWGSNFYQAICSWVKRAGETEVLSVSQKPWPISPGMKASKENH